MEKPLTQLVNVESTISMPVKLDNQAQSRGNASLGNALIHDQVFGDITDTQNSGSETDWSKDKLPEDMTRAIATNRLVKKNNPARKILDALLAAF